MGDGHHPPESYGPYRSELVSTIQQTREGYHVAEALERVSRAARMATRTQEQELTMGALVDYYTEPSEKHAAKWRGPATIVALERDLVLVRH